MHFKSIYAGLLRIRIPKKSISFGISWSEYLLTLNTLLFLYLLFSFLFVQLLKNWIECHPYGNSIALFPLSPNWKYLHPRSTLPYGRQAKLFLRNKMQSGDDMCSAQRQLTTSSIMDRKQFSYQMEAKHLLTCESCEPKRII